MEGPSIENQVIVALRRISRAIDLHSRALLQQYGMTAPQLAALHAVAAIQPASASTVAKRVHVSLATLSGIFNRLEGRGLLRRSRGGSDRRTVMVSLTESGAHLLESAPSLLQDRFRQELRKLHQWEQTLLLSSLQRVATMMEIDQIEPQMETAPVLSTGMITALPEEMARYFSEAAQPADDASARCRESLN